MKKAPLWFQRSLVFFLRKMEFALSQNPEKVAKRQRSLKAMSKERLRWF
jgi:hypothetical protein